MSESIVLLATDLIFVEGSSAAHLTIMMEKLHIPRFGHELAQTGCVISQQSESSLTFIDGPPNIGKIHQYLTFPYVIEL